MNSLAPASPVPFAVRTRKLTWGMFLIGFLVSAGLLLTWLLLVIWILQLIPAERRADGVRYENLTYTTQGEPVILQTLESSVSRILDLRRRVLDMLPEDANRRSTSLPPPDTGRTGSVIPGFKVTSLGESQTQSASWYAVEDCDRVGFGYFTAIHPLTKRTTGYIGTNGWQEDRPAARDQFDLRNGGIFGGNYGRYGSQNAYEASGTPFTTLILVSRGQALQVDLEHRQIRAMNGPSGVHAAAEVYAIIKRTSGVQTWTDSKATGQIALRTEDQIILLDPANGKQQSWPLTDPRVRDANSFLFLENGELLASQMNAEFDERTGLKRSLLYNLFWLNSAGDILKSDSVEFPASSRREWVVIQTAISLSGTPLVIGLMNGLLVPLQLAESAKYHYLTAVQQLLPVIWLTLLLAVGFAVLATFLARKHAQAHSMRLHPAWYLMLALLGLPGYFGYRWHRHWPSPVIPPAPIPNGTEILVPSGNHLLSSASAR